MNQLLDHLRPKVICRYLLICLSYNAIPTTSANHSGKYVSLHLNASFTARDIAAPWQQYAAPNTAGAGHSQEQHQLLLMLTPDTNKSVCSWTTGFFLLGEEKKKRPKKHLSLSLGKFILSGESIHLNSVLEGIFSWLGALSVSCDKKSSM